MTKSLFLSALETPFHPSWSDVVDGGMITELVGVEKQIGQDRITPRKELVLRFFGVDLNRVKVVILGQDPYPQEGIATGRAFEVANLTDWRKPFQNPSLKNIVRGIYRADYSEVKRYSEIWQTGFTMLPPDRLFENWESQGVLLLNTAFTCIVGQSNSHADIWQQFSQKLLFTLSEKISEAIWFLWGRNAQERCRNLNINRIVSHHPMICHPRPYDFLYGEINPFSETRNLIRWTGLE